MKTITKLVEEHVHRWQIERTQSSEEKKGVSTVTLSREPGSGGRIGRKKVNHISRIAFEKGYPIINLGEAGGARIPDIQGSDGLSSLTVGTRYGIRKRQVPMVAPRPTHASSWVAAMPLSHSRLSCDEGCAYIEVRRWLWLGLCAMGWAVVEAR